jgi:hypothetical protein
MRIPLSIITTNNILIMNNKSIQNAKKKKCAARIKVDEKSCVVSAAINILGVPPEKRQPPAGATAAALTEQEHAHT